MRILFTLIISLFWLTSFSQSATALVYVCTPCNNQCDESTYDQPGTCNHCGMPLIEKSKAEITASVQKKKIAFYLQPGVEVLDFAGPMEVFSYAGYEVFTVSKTKDPITSQGILKVVPDYSIEDAPQADILAFFGGNSGAASNDSAVIHWVQTRPQVDYYLSVCTGAFVLAEAGILNGKTATTFHNALDRLESDYPEIDVRKNVRFVDNGKVITTAGISAGIDGALHLVAKMNGFNAARSAAYYMEYDKWIPGEGLLLTEENPYAGIEQVEHLEDYVGTYEYLENTEIQLKINPREKSLYAVVQGQNYPLFYLEKDKFLDLTDHEVVFERDENQQIISYHLKEQVEEFKKLD